MRSGPSCKGALSHLQEADDVGVGGGVVVSPMDDFEILSAVGAGSLPAGAATCGVEVSSEDTFERTPTFR